jgi:putative FmdB family regulatory protein
MPVYEYQCGRCGHEFEREQRISDKPVRKCPSCGAMKAKRLISRTSFVLKGGGWYSDLYGSPKSGGKPAEAGSGEGTAGSDAKSDAKSDATPLAASDAKRDSGAAEKGGSKAKKKTPRAAA